MSSDQIRKGLEDVIIDESELSCVFGDQGRLVFRSYDIEDIAEHGDFEETLYLLWYGRLPTESEYDEFVEELVAERDIPAEIMRLLKDLAALDQHPMNALQSAVAALGGYPDSRDINFEEDTESVIRIGQSITAKIATITAAYFRLRNGMDPVEPRSDLSHAANFLYMMHGEVPAPAETEAMDTSLQIHMDHGTNASTFTARVIASTLASPYQAVAGGIGALAGSLHGGANQDFIGILAEIEASEQEIDEWIDDYLAEGGVVYGYGHRVYNVKDPRAYILQDRTETLIDGSGDDKWYEMAREIEEYMGTLGLEERGIFPNVDFYSGTMYKNMDVPTDMFTNVFTLSRIGGWIGHIIEQYQDNRIMRPRVRYVGDAHSSWTPIEDR